MRPLYQAQYGEDVTGSVPDDYWVHIDADHRALLECVTDRDAEGANRIALRHIDYIVSATS